jgi:hypothetical protein
MRSVDQKCMVIVCGTATERSVAHYGITVEESASTRI